MTESSTNKQDIRSFPDTVALSLGNVNLCRTAGNVNLCRTATLISAVRQR
jgi:hypothetical protein